jgi:hypothetical protein
MKPCMCRKCGVRACQRSRCKGRGHHICSSCYYRSHKEKVKRGIKKYRQTEKGHERSLVAQRKFHQTAKYRAGKARYRRTVKGMTTEALYADRYRSTPEYKEHARYRDISWRRARRIKENRI